ncbi:hypothetical protein Val02_29060 [Virgisporangium aliadipatigenens]|uniref:Uncharacterized protein n=1 Tax=Virgisporangium aliadipatigenens TaxID=741659 RepID=A0A8J3YLC7_9ACTN|nr:hypothetical protein Val02_29060 [Virgisporangium aliadipatigenens]
MTHPMGSISRARRASAPTVAVVATDPRAPRNHTPVFSAVIPGPLSGARGTRRDGGVVGVYLTVTRLVVQDARRARGEKKERAGTNFYMDRQNFCLEHPKGG